ncbi:hypothetical protein FHR81_000645 [Actinoalloteichus hoggarensis]|uniref:Uncharacterized protein n=1 Tax=Actinoalloteichus hoggarensis TaxID=1470176 RepID=A0A221W1N9_9PSEU|nr:DUF4262 domain-containing protein [Actinoalloteichus hoggarensis]ASO19677.1 hypothetical protein AHOG_10170 [Actinoalloteichus hoggarensis]MBB5919616.1 hypothetical protein [Actinoalloteichus hoggarensis]
MLPGDEEARRRLLADAEEHGAAVVHVGGDRNGPPFAFTVGLWRRCGSPEAVAVGMPPKVAHAVLNQFVQRVLGGETFGIGQCYDGFIQDCPITFERVARGYYAEYFGHALLIYRKGDFPAVQLIAASPDGAWPWEPDAPSGLVRWQRILTDSGRPESWIPGDTGP